jgi:hypothetical protein
VSICGGPQNIFAQIGEIQGQIHFVSNFDSQNEAANSWRARPRTGTMGTKRLRYADGAHNHYATGGTRARSPRHHASLLTAAARTSPPLAPGL